MDKRLKLITGSISFVLLLIVVFLSYKLYNSIMKPIRFQKAFDYRAQIVKDKMIKIREAEIAYLNVYDRYTGDFDTLVDFIKHGYIPVVKAEGEVPDSLVYEIGDPRKAELKALKMGIIKRDTIKVPVIDSLFKNYDVDTLPYVPFTHLTEKFQLRAGKIKTLSNAVRPVFELKVHNNTFTKGLDRQMVINMNDAARDNDEYPGFVIGSMEEVTTAGNWD